MLRLKGVSKSYEGREVLRAVDLDLPTGRTSVLIGQSGCGKSTLLRLMIGLVPADGGTIQFDGSPVTPESAPRLRPRMGLVLQEGGLFPHLTATGNVTLMARWLGWGAPKIAARLDELARLTMLPRDALGRYPAQLSGGQRQRVSLMRALMLDPDLLLLDEPLGALDPMIRSDLQADLRAIFRALGKTVVLVTHDLAEAGFLGDTIVLMREGTIVQSGPLEDLVRAPVDPFVTRFINAQRLPLPGIGGAGS